ncbi:MAG: bifunctional diaminohydroxyphosphoribosylaminopyrimidine deaminase/5-amino-6-(5-phosphoribosylamino)uracil reductase RibD [Flexistipes sinusarabici]|uniref:Riboflavin biosynthesis protein RibD n=1 Tax=Flexistipes sinusarabici TaxID=2352 RepID=A0A5D0MPN3_FLESI|nr:bifunctional diaminohydroxyphosphoribosylaminopyrimidine deaminase/5-amino-6-(5-phosphoribosylamino)uracil reductase RibD [Flexistipes sinusarabici]TYB33501.1 MAG: bifunctional diaminohydroxyphosphoribosylaminopyrimidine deaminase/5-amino-6-(5-phosphoribosylamino)uracil reductase RibD [Flexistipes sinusarabici]
MADPHEIMLECVNLALAGKGHTKTNPVVGAMIVQNGRVIGRGFHKSFGGDHAEIEAINDCEEETNGSDLYVTLEPCSHFGKTPPCVETIVKKGIKRVFVGVVDPNPANAGKGIEYLLKNGVEVYVGFAERASAEIIEEFAKYIYKKQPFYSLKIAQTLDGKIAAKDGSSRWITDETSRQHAHYIRSVSDGILTGIGTVQADDPELNARFLGLKKYPYKIILDSSLKISAEAAIFNEKPEKCIIFTSISNFDEKTVKIDTIRKTGAEIIPCSKLNDGLDLQNVSDELVKRGILNVLIEGGGKIHASFIREDMADKAYVFIAGKILGAEGIDSLGSLNISNIEKCKTLSDLNVTRLKNDFLFTGKFYDYSKDVISLTKRVRNRCSPE